MAKKIYQTDKEIERLVAEYPDVPSSELFKAELERLVTMAEANGIDEAIESCTTSSLNSRRN